MFEYNKRFWQRMFEADDEPSEPNKTYYGTGMVAGILLGGIAGYFLGSTVPLATLGGFLGLWIGNTYDRKK